MDTKTLLASIGILMTALQAETPKQTVTKFYDLNKDGKLDKAEQSIILKEYDLNEDGKLDQSERRALVKAIKDKLAAKQTEKTVKDKVVEERGLPSTVEPKVKYSLKDLKPIKRTTEKISFVEKNVASFGEDSWHRLFYRNKAYKCGLSGHYTFVVIEPKNSPGKEAPLWVYLHGGGVGYFDEKGEYHANTNQTKDSWNHEESFTDLLKSTCYPPIVSDKKKPIDNTIARRLKEGYRLLLVSLSDHDLYSGLGKPYPNNPKGGEVNGLQATMAAVDYTISKYPTTHVFAHGCSAGGHGVWSLALGYASEGKSLTGVVSDSGLTTPRMASIFAAFCGKRKYVYPADFDLDSVTEKVGVMADFDYPFYPEAAVKNGFKDCPILFISGAADSRATAGNQTPIAEAKAAKLNNVNWVYDGVRQAVAQQPNSPHEVSVIDGAGHSPTAKEGVANDIVDKFIKRALKHNPAAPFNSKPVNKSE